MSQSSIAPSYAMLSPGDPAPWFHQVATSNPNYSFASAAGRYIVLCFFGSAGDETGRQMLAAVEAGRSLFDDQKIALFGISVDPQDRATGRVEQSLPGIRHFWDADSKVSRLYGALPANTASDVPARYRRFWIVLDPNLRARAIFAFGSAGEGQSAVLAYLRDLPALDRYAGLEIHAPVIVIPNVFEPDFCRSLIGLYEEHGGEETGFMQDVGGKTLKMTDHSRKRRKDYTVSDEGLRQRIQQRIKRRVFPEIEKVHFFKATRMERYIVSCYAAEDGGHFSPHRDNTTLATAHRRYAVSINLNDEFDGGEVSFPEYSRRGYKAPPGGAVVFSCPLLHTVSTVTRGRRYAFLPFLYDEEAAKIREANCGFLGDGTNEYRATA